MDAGDHAGVGVLVAAVVVYGQQMDYALKEVVVLSGVLLLPEVIL